MYSVCVCVCLRERERERERERVGEKERESWGERQPYRFKKLVWTNGYGMTNCDW